jgi:hypothetical protein
MATTCGAMKGARGEARERPCAVLPDPVSPTAVRPCCSGAPGGVRTPASTDIRRHQLERDLRAKAADHAARRLSTNSYLAEHERLTAELDALEEQPGPPLGDIEEAVAALTSMRDAWRDADLEARAQLVGRVYQRITVADGAIVKEELTEAAKRHGFLEALPETVVMARPAGLEPTTFRSAT